MTCDEDEKDVFERLSVRFGWNADGEHACLITETGHIRWIDAVKSHFGAQNELFLLKSSRFGSRAGVLKLETLLQTTALQLASRIDMENPLLMRCFDGLQSILSTKYKIPAFADRTGALTIEQVALNRFMMVDAETRHALRISALPASIKKRGPDGSAKKATDAFETVESLLLLHANSVVGRAMLRQWLRTPLQSVAAIERRQAGVRFFIEPHRALLATQLATTLRAVKNVAPMVRHLANKARRATLADWTNLCTALESVTAILRLTREEEGQTPFTGLFDGFAALDIGELAAFDNLVRRVVDFEASASAQRLMVRAGVDAQLDDMRTFYDGLGTFFDDVGREEMHSIAPNLPQITAISISYYPQIGCNLVIAKADVDALLAAIGGGLEALLPLGLEYQFQTEQNVYFKNNRMLELDEFLGDIHSDMVDAEDALLRELESAVLKFCPGLLAGLDFCATVDCVLALASLAKAHSYVCPRMTDGQQSIYIVRGRHPLLELMIARPRETGATAAFIPNNAELDETHRIQLISGPNFSGKSSYIKQVGLIVFLAHIGSFVPCDAAQIGIVDRIFSRLRSNDSVGRAAAASTFALDTQQVARALHQATGRSLLLIDEFGRGTDAFDGVALLVALLDHLAHSPSAPKAMIVTHFTAELASLGALSKPPLDTTVLSTHATFVVADDARGFVPLYEMARSSPGAVLPSFGIECARQGGFSASIIARARDVYAKTSTGQPVAALETATVATQQRDAERSAALAAFDALGGAAGLDEASDEAVVGFVETLKGL